MNAKYQRTVLALSLVSFFAVVFARFVLSPLVPIIAREFDITTGAIGVALTGMWFMYAVSQFPSGVLSDRFGERRVIIVALSFTVLGSLFLAFAPSFRLFVVFAVILGAGSGLYYSVATTLLTKLFENTGRALGVHDIGTPAAGLTAPIVASYLGTQYGWRSAVLSAAVIAFVALVGVSHGVKPRRPDGNHQSVAEMVEFSLLRDVLGQPSIRYTLFIAILSAFAWQATASFLPTFFVEHHGFSIQKAGLFFSAFSVLQGGMRVTTGWLSDRFSRDAAIFLTTAAAIVGYCLLVFSQILVLLAAGLACTALGMSWTPPVQSRFMDSFADDERGMRFGLVRTIFMAVGSLGSTVVGALATTTGWVAAFGLLAVLMFIALLTVVLLRPNKGPFAKLLQRPP